MSRVRFRQIEREQRALAGTERIPASVGHLDDHLQERVIGEVAADAGQVGGHVEAGRPAEISWGCFAGSGDRNRTCALWVMSELVTVSSSQIRSRAAHRPGGLGKSPRSRLS
jgi:hypothetical protein